MKYLLLTLFASFSCVCAADDMNAAVADSGDFVKAALDKYPPLLHDDVRRDAEFFFFIRIEDYLKELGASLDEPREEIRKELNKYIKTMKRDPRIEVIVYNRYPNSGNIPEDVIQEYIDRRTKNYEDYEIKAPFYIITRCDDTVKVNSFISKDKNQVPHTYIVRGIVTVVDHDGLVLGEGDEFLLKYWRDFTIKPLAPDKLKRKMDIYAKKKAQTKEREEKRESRRGSRHGTFGG